MPERSVYNFSAGPAVLPEDVLRESREALWDLDGSGIGVLEHSHRGRVFAAVYQQAIADCRKLAGIGDDFEVLLLPGGAATQFFMLPANFLPKDGHADYLITGLWSEKALAEARFYGDAHVAWREEPFCRVPEPGEINWSDDAPAFAHYTANNTICGTQWPAPPAPPPGVWLACDASSDIFSRPLELAHHGCIYASAQKNLGPAGVTLVILRRDLLEAGARVRELPSMQRYDRALGSMFNTPATFAIYVMGRVFSWLLKQGGLEAMARRNHKKAQVVYDALEEPAGFYHCTANKGSRSLMNLTFRTPSTALDRAFLAEAEAAGFSGLGGHRSIGGMRASIYNAFPLDGCQALAAFLRDFARRNG